MSTIRFIEPSLCSFPIQTLHIWVNKLKKRVHWLYWSEAKWFIILPYLWFILTYVIMIIHQNESKNKGKASITNWKLFPYIIWPITIMTCWCWDEIDFIAKIIFQNLTTTMKMVNVFFFVIGRIECLILILFNPFYLSRKLCM